MMRYKALAFAGVLVLASVAFGASAFTSSTITRDSTIDVTTDTNGLIALEDHSTGTLIDEQSGQLNIDLSRAAAGTGVNVDSTYTFGDTSSPFTKRAFNITNNGDQSVTLDITYTGVDSTAIGDGNDQVAFKVYDNSGSNVANVSEESGISGHAIASGESLSVILVIDTTYGTVSSADTLSGTLKVVA